MADERLEDLWKTADDEPQRLGADPFFGDLVMGKAAEGPAVQEFLEGAVEERLNPAGLEGEKFTGVRELAETRGKTAVALDSPSGTRVRFAGTLEALLSYANAPEPGMEGTVVTVRTSSGKTTFADNRLFVKWDNGEFMATLPQHLEAGKTSKKASMVRMSFSSLGDISGMFTSSESNDELVHRATKDLWSFKKEGDQYVLERLFDENGGPLKV